MTTLGVYGISYQYLSQPVLREVSFELNSGEILALFGPNGSGKSTLMKAVAGILPLWRLGCEGQVRYHGQNFLEFDPAVRSMKIAYVGSDLRAEFPLTAYEAVLLGRTCPRAGFWGTDLFQSRGKVHWAMEKCFCLGLAPRELHTLSGGERQLVALAQALVRETRVLFLDETLSRMDLNHQSMIGKMLRELASQGWAIFIVSHDVNLASEWADRCLLLRNGQKIADGKLKEIWVEKQVRELYPGADLRVGVNPITGTPKVFFGSR